MAGEIALNTAANPVWLPTPNASGGLVFAVVVANTNALTAVLAAAVPQYSFAIVLSTKQIFVTEDNVNWQAYS